MPHLETGNGHQVNKKTRQREAVPGVTRWGPGRGRRPGGSLQGMALSSPGQVGGEGTDCFVTNWHHRQKQGHLQMEQAFPSS